MSSLEATNNQSSEEKVIGTFRQLCTKVGMWGKRNEVTRLNVQVYRIAYRSEPLPMGKVGYNRLSRKEGAVAEPLNEDEAREFVGEIENVIITSQLISGWIQIYSWEG